MTARQMRELDRRAKEEFGIPEEILMEHAGWEVARCAKGFLASSGKAEGAAWILAGAGANGGDGFVAARHLDNWGFPVRVALLAPRGKVRGAAQLNLEILRRLAVPLVELPTQAAWNRWAREVRPIRLVIDALLGTGFSGPVREPLHSAIRWTNQRRCPVVSVDLPSGLSADTGEPSPVAVRATVTVTCGFPKVGLFRGQGRYLRGRVRVADISLPRMLRRLPSQWS